MLDGRNIGIVQEVVKVSELTNQISEAHLDEFVRDFDQHSSEYRSNSIDILMHMQRTAPFARSSNHGGFYVATKASDCLEISGRRRRPGRPGITSQARSAAGLVTSPVAIPARRAHL